MAGPIRDLGMASRFGMIIRAECRCGRFREFHASELVLRLGAGRDPYRLRFKCRACAPLAKVMVREAPKPETQPVPDTRPTVQPIDTIADHIAKGYTLRAYCERHGANPCGHSVELDLQALGRRLGFDHPCRHHDLAPKLKCSACGSRKVSLRVSPLSKPPL